MEALDVIGSSSRWRLLELLSAGERSVGELAEEMGISNQGVLKHLAVLVDAGLVKEVRHPEDRKVGYALRSRLYLAKWEDEDGELVVYYRGKAKASKMPPETEFRANRFLKRFKLLMDKPY